MSSRREASSERSYSALGRVQERVDGGLDKYVICRPPRRSWLPPRSSARAPSELGVVYGAARLRNVVGGRRRYAAATTRTRATCDGPSRRPAESSLFFSVAYPYNTDGIFRTPQGRAPSLTGFRREPGLVFRVEAR